MLRTYPIIHPATYLTHISAPQTTQTQYESRYGSFAAAAELVSELANYNVRQVCCGAAHSVALNEWGQCFVWGSNSRGQLAKPMASEAMCEIPKLVKQLATRHVVQIASGLYHTMALTDGGELFAWGSNAYGQLGLGEFGEPVSQPTLVTALCGVPVAFIACGGNHSFVVSK